MRTRTVIILAIIALVNIKMPSSAHAQINGNAFVIDGDTIEAEGIRVRFFGIDAPEKRQTCYTSKGQSYKCGQRSTAYLRRIIGSHRVYCEDLGKAKFNRRWGRCFAGRVNLQSEMVRTGHARAYRFHSNEYFAEQKLAQKNHFGIWQGFHVRPGKFRKKGGSPRECSG